MAAYYNECDPFAAQWLRNLIAAGHIAPGDVDERSITDVQPADLMGFTQCHFFAGIGGWSYALRLAGWGDDRPVWTGSCPCQPFSPAGKGEGFADPRHLWPDWFRLLRECRPVTVFGEQSGAALTWFDLVSGDLEGEGYAVGAALVGAHSVAAPHKRERLYFVAEPSNQRHERGGNARGRGARLADDGAIGGVAHPLGERGCGGESGGTDASHARQPGQAGFWDGADWLPCTDGKSRPTKPGLFPLAHGVPGRVGLLRGAGNAIVPEAASAFIQAYKERAPNRGAGWGA